MNRISLSRKHLGDLSQRVLGMLVRTKICCQERGHTHIHAHGLLFRRKPIVQRGDRWRGQAVSEEVKQKQAEDCFLHLSFLRCLETSLLSALCQGTTFQPREKTLFTWNNFFQCSMKISANYVKIMPKCTECFGCLAFFHFPPLVFF